MSQQPQIMDFRTGQPVQQQPVQQPGLPQINYFPSFPRLAAQVDQHATRIPWYVWAAAGAYAMYRIKKG